MRVLLLLLLATPAFAEDDPKTERARSHLRAGASYYDAGKYQDALREMEMAYALRPVADLQYNLAQCHERMGHLDEAARAYRAYLQGKPDAEDRALVEERIKNLELRGELAKKGEAPPPPPPEEKVVFKTIVVYREAPPAPGRGARIAAYGLAVLGAGALAAAITFGVLAQQKAALVTDGATPAEPARFEGEFSDAEETGRTYQIISWVGYGVAALAAAGAVGLFLLGRKIDREAPRLTFAPSLSPSGGGLAVAGSF